MLAIDRYFDERNENFRARPKRAGNKIWGKEIVDPSFDEANNCKDPRLVSPKSEGRELLRQTLTPPGQRTSSIFSHQHYLLDVMSILEDMQPRTGLITSRITIVPICMLVSVIAPMCPAQTEQQITGKSATGNITWEIRPPADSRGLSTVWLWPDGQKDKATQLGGADIPGVQDIEFSADDAWIVIQSHLSSGSFFSFYRKQADGSYAEDKPAEDFFENGQIEKTATSEQVDRWSVSFEKWTDDFGPYAFIFSWSARLSRRGPDTYFMHYCQFQKYLRM